MSSRAASIARMSKRIIAAGLVLAGSLVLAPLAPATAAPATVSGSPVVASHVVTAKAKVFKNCKALNKVYKGGVAKKGVKYNKVSGKKRAFKVKPPTRSSTATRTASPARGERPSPSLRLTGSPETLGWRHG